MPRTARPGHPDRTLRARSRAGCARA